MEEQNYMTAGDQDMCDAVLREMGDNHDGSDGDTNLGDMEDEPDGRV
jgi:hypothetical protein